MFAVGRSYSYVGLGVRLGIKLGLLATEQNYTQSRICNFNRLIITDIVTAEFSL